MTSPAERTDIEVLRLAAFTDDPAAGNPAGVVLDARGLDDDAMLAIAADVGYSETAFLSPEGHGTDGEATIVVDGDREDRGDPKSPRFRVRYFSPRAEVDFCGHATIATGVALGRRGTTGLVDLVTNAGLVRVRIAEEEGRTVAALTSVPASSRDLDPESVAVLLEVLRVQPADLADERPVRVAFAGNDHPVVVLRSRQRLADLDYDYAAADRLMAEQRWTTLQVVVEDGDGTIHSRNPFPPGGVVEDPATGAAAAALGAYLRDLGLVARPAELRVLQGEDMGSPSTILVHVPAAGDEIIVRGTAVEIP